MHLSLPGVDEWLRVGILVKFHLDEGGCSYHCTQVGRRCLGVRPSSVVQWKVLASSGDVGGVESRWVRVAADTDHCV